MNEIADVIDKTEADRLLAIAVDTLTLDTHFAAGRPGGYQEITINADTLFVHGAARLPGKILTIHARRIVSEQGVIDVSGQEPEVDFNIDARDSALDGTPQSPDGKPGAPGSPGAPGGVIRILAGEIVGDLTIVAEGGRGGNSQPGGNGVRPAPPHGANGSFTSREPPKGPYGAKVVLGRSLVHSYVAIAYGQNGGNGLKGGDAGAPGQPGDGGSGGRIEVLTVAPPESKLDLRADGRSAGRAGEDAQSGPPGRGGQGGRHRVCLYNLLWGGWNEDFADGSNKHIKDAVREQKLGTRAAAGKPGTQAGIVPESPTALNGPAGETWIKQVPPEAMADHTDAAALSLILEAAQADAQTGNRQRAEARCRWVESIAQKMTEPAAKVLLESAEACLKRINVN